jgi:hypothetical protein
MNENVEKKRTQKLPPMPGVALLVASVERVEVIVPGRTIPCNGAGRRIPGLGAKELLLGIPHILDQENN